MNMKQVETNIFLITKAIDYLFIDRTDLFAENLAVLYTNQTLPERKMFSKILGDKLLKKIIAYKNGETDKRF